jgi:cbb3-type cytochrome oxidase subunit 3
MAFKELNKAKIIFGLKKIFIVNLLYFYEMSKEQALLLLLLLFFIIIIYFLFYFFEKKKREKKKKLKLLKCNRTSLLHSIFFLKKKTIDKSLQIRKSLNKKLLMSKQNLRYFVVVNPYYY